MYVVLQRCEDDPMVKDTIVGAFDSLDFVERGIKKIHKKHLEIASWYHRKHKCTDIMKDYVQTYINERIIEELPHYMWRFGLNNIPHKFEFIVTKIEVNEVSIECLDIWS